MVDMVTTSSLVIRFYGARDRAYRVNVRGGDRNISCVCTIDLFVSRSLIDSVATMAVALLGQELSGHRT